MTPSLSEEGQEGMASSTERSAEHAAPKGANETLVADSWEPSQATPGDEVKLWVVVASPRVGDTDLWIGGHRVQVPNDALRTSWAFANLHSPSALERAVAEYERAMREDVIPQINADLRAQAAAAVRLRLGLPLLRSQEQTPPSLEVMPEGLTDGLAQDEPISSRDELREAVARIITVIRAMDDEYELDDECDYVKINQFIEHLAELADEISPPKETV